MNVWTQRAWALTLLALLIVLAALTWGYWAAWQRYDQGLNQLEARGQRLEGVAKLGDRIQTRLDAVASNIQPWLHPGGANAANDVQQRLRELITASGSTLISSQVALQAPAEGASLASVRLTATLSGEWAALMRFTQSLHTSTPPLWVRAASFMRDGQVDGKRGQNARLTLQLEAPLAPATPEKAQP